MGLFEPNVKKELRSYFKTKDFIFASHSGKQNKNMLTKTWGRYTTDDSLVKKIIIILESKSLEVKKQEGKNGRFESKTIKYDTGLNGIISQAKEFAPFLEDPLD